MEGQRLLSCRNARESSKMYIWTIIMLFVMLAVMTLPALGALAKWPALYTAPGPERELVFGRLLGTYLPPGLLGLALVAMFASIMSTVDSNMNFGAQVFVNDIYRRSLRPGASMRSCMLVGKLVMLAILGLALLVATIGNHEAALALAYRKALPDKHAREFSSKKACPLITVSLS